MSAVYVRPTYDKVVPGGLKNSEAQLKNCLAIQLLRGGATCTYVSSSERQPTEAATATVRLCQGDNVKSSEQAKTPNAR